MQAAVSLCRPGGRFGHMLSCIRTCEGAFSLGGVVRTPEQDWTLQFMKQSFTSADTSAAGNLQSTCTDNKPGAGPFCDLPALTQINLLRNNTASPL